MSDVEKFDHTLLDYSAMLLLCLMVKVVELKEPVLWCKWRTHLFEELWLTVFCEIDAKLRNHHIIRISPVQLTLRNCEISSVCYQNVQYSVDFAKLRNQSSLLSEFPVSSVDFAKFRNQLSLLSEFPLFSWFCEIAKSVQFAIRISTV